MFVTAVERALIKGMADGGRKVYLRSEQLRPAIRLLTEHVGIDTFLVTVSPMDRRRCTSLWRLLQQVAPRGGSDCRGERPRTAFMARWHHLHISEVETIVENNVPLLEIAGAKVGTGGRGHRQDDRRDGADGTALQMGVGVAGPGLRPSSTAGRTSHPHRRLCPGMIGLIEAGVVTNRRKRQYRQDRLHLRHGPEGHVPSWTTTQPSKATRWITLTIRTSSPRTITSSPSTLRCRST